MIVHVDSLGWNTSKQATLVELAMRLGGQCNSRYDPARVAGGRRLESRPRHSRQFGLDL